MQEYIVHTSVSGPTEQYLYCHHTRRAGLTVFYNESVVGAVNDFASGGCGQLMRCLTVYKLKFYVGTISFEFGV